MLARLYTKLCQLSPGFNKSTKRFMYQFMAGYYRRKDWSFMNYGYAPLDPRAKELRLDKADEPNRYGIQLYHHVASAIDLEGGDVLEVGSGRGGGSCYIKSYLGPKAVVGVDFSPKAVAFCNECYCVEGLSFVAGDAESLPFADSSFDAVVNVESSHCYGSMGAFLAQVRNVLRHGGYFLCADFRGKDDVDTLHAQLHRSGLTLIKDTVITPNVIKARDLENEHRMAHIRREVPRLLLKLFQEFAGVKGSRIYERFQTGDAVYKSFVLQKPVD